MLAVPPVGFTGVIMLVGLAVGCYLTLSRALGLAIGQCYVRWPIEVGNFAEAITSIGFSHPVEIRMIIKQKTFSVRKAGLRLLVGAKFVKGGCHCFLVTRKQGPMHGIEGSAI